MFENISAGLDPIASELYCNAAYQDYVAIKK